MGACSGMSGPVRLHGGRSDVGLGLAEAGDPVPGFPLAAGLEYVDSLEAFENAALGGGGTLWAKTSVL